MRMATRKEARHNEPSSLGYLPRRSSLLPAGLAGLALWLMLWAGYNTGPGYVLDPAFPSSNWELVHGLRAFLPLLAGWLALTMLLARQRVVSQAVEGPLGLLIVFAFVGLLASALLSEEPLQALYWAFAMGAIILVLMAVLCGAEEQPAMSRLLTLNWLIATALTLGILIGLPFLGGPSPSLVNPLDPHAHWGRFATPDFIGMAGTRNTGLARYAAVAGVAAAGRLWQGRFPLRAFWFLVLLLSGYALLFAQGRTETVGFVVGVTVILLLRRTGRLLLLGWGSLAGLLMWRAETFERLWIYGTRTGQFDPTLSGRIATWKQGWELFQQSPWVGFGFQADRYFLGGQHMHSALLHALVETGLLGTIPFVLAFVLAGVLVVRLYSGERSRRSPALLDEIPGVLALFLVMSLMESTAYFSANLLFCAPVLAYLQLMAWKRRLPKWPERRAARDRVSAVRGRRPVGGVWGEQQSLL